MNKLFSYILLERILSRRVEEQALTPRTLPKKAKTAKGMNIGWLSMFLLALLVFVVASRYLSLDPDVYFPEQKEVYISHTAFLLMHIIGSMLAILIGPFQFLQKIRTGRLLNLHRWLGRIYLLSVLVGGFGGLYMAQFAYGGLVTQLGFGGLGLLWLFTGWMAYILIRNKDIERHREWMTRNYALTFAGVMLRLWMPTFVMLGIDFTDGYIVTAWLCWVPNLFVAQWLINRRRVGERDLNDY